MTLELPITLVSKIDRRLQAVVRRTSSNSSGADQIQDWLGEWWTYSLTFATHTRDEGRKVGAFFNRLRGPAVPFLLSDPSFQTSLAGATAPSCAAAAWLADTLSTTGWAANAVIPAGTFFNIGAGDATRLYQVSEDAVASAGGAATITIAPRLRSAITSATPLVFSAPKVLLRLDDVVPSIIETAELYTFSVAAKEAL